MDSFSDLFRSGKPALIMSLPINDEELGRAAFEEGADAVKVHINLHHNAGGEDLGDYESNRDLFDRMLFRAKGPMGIVPGASPEAILKDIDKVRASDFAFVSFYSSFLPVSALPIRQELMAACDKGFTLGEVAAYEKAGASVIEASVVPTAEYGTPLNFKDLAVYGAIAGCTRLPVVVPTQRFIEPKDVKYLAACGVRGIMIGAIVTGKTQAGIASAVRAFRKAIDEL